MTTDIFTNKWFMTLFACFLPFHLVQPIFDMFLLEGWAAIFKVGLAMLQELEPRLITMDLAEICMFFRDSIKGEADILDQFKLFARSGRIRVNKILKVRNSSY